MVIATRDKDGLSSYVLNGLEMRKTMLRRRWERKRLFQLGRSASLSPHEGS